MWEFIAGLLVALAGALGLLAFRNKQYKRLEKMPDDEFVREVSRSLNDKELKELTENSKTFADAMLKEMESRGTKIYFRKDD